MSAIYTVLAEGDDQLDPIVDAARAILDGHIVLTRELAERGHYPAIDIAQSISRCMPLVSSAAHQSAARRLIATSVRYARVRDLLPLGAYVPGGDPESDRAVELYPRIETFLRQGVNENTPLAASVALLEEVMA
jgi:flagellum-specific ATP synthase